MGRNVLIMQVIFFFRCHMKIVVAIVTTKVKMLQKHMNPKNVILTRRLTFTICLLDSFAGFFLQTVWA